MFWFIIGAIAVVAVFSISGAANKFQETEKKRETNDKIKDKASAYADYLKRTSDDDSVQEMSENELREYVSDNMHAYRTESENAGSWYGLLIVAVVIVGIIVSVVYQGIQPMIPVIFVAGWAWRMGKQKASDVDAKYLQLGFDVERLKLK